MDNEMEYTILKNSIDTIASLTCSSPEKVIDLLTGFCWDEEEAGGIKEAKNLITALDLFQRTNHEPT